MRVPIWLTLGVAALVIAFGSYRIWRSFKKPEPEGEAGKRSLLGGGYYRMSPRTHLLVGIVYLLLGGALIATSFGWSPLGFGTTSESPNQRPKGAIPIDTTKPTSR